MSNLILYDREVTLEQYIRYEVARNDGMRTRLSSSVMKAFLADLNIKHRKNITKSEILDLIYTHNGNDWERVAELLQIGVGVNQYLNAFSFVTKADIKRLEKLGILKVVGYQEFRAYGKECHAVLYDILQYIGMTDAAMQNLLLEYPKGKRANKCRN